MLGCTKAMFYLPFILFSLGCSEQTSSQIIVGLLAPKTGIMAPHGESLEMGIRVAEMVINKNGGILGKQIKVIVLDTRSDPATASMRARELIDRHQAILLIGTGLSSETLATIPLSKESKVPFIYSMDGELKTCSNNNIHEVSDLVWGAGFTERMIVRPFLEYLNKEVLSKDHKPRVYLLGGDYVYPRITNKFARFTAESLGFQIMGEEYTDVSTSDYTAVIRRILQSKADLLLVTNPGTAAAVFMRQAKQLGLDKKMIISGFATFAQEAVAEMGDAAEGVVYANRYSQFLSNKKNEEFVAAFRELYPDTPLLPGPTAAAGGYGALMVAAAAFDKAGTTHHKEFYVAMKGLELGLPQGQIVVDSTNNIFQQHIYLLRVHNQKYEVIADLGLQKHPGLDGCSVS